MLGQTPLDIAASWADLRVYDIVKTKWDSLPPLPDKKKGGKGGKKPAAKKRPASGPSADGKVGILWLGASGSARTRANL